MRWRTAVDFPIVYIKTSAHNFLKRLGLRN
jgi:hypothetical protein